MSEPLHSVHALRDVVENAPEPARSWAAALLHLWHPGPAPWPQIVHPLGPAGWTPTLLADRELHVPSAPPGPGWAALVTEAPRVGARVGDGASHALRQGFAHAEPGHRPELALALGSLGALEANHLREAAPHADPPSLATLVMWRAASQGEASAVAEDALGPLEDDALRVCLDLLGAPRSRPAAHEPDAIVHALADALGIERPQPPRVKGARARRAAAWVKALLVERDDALSHALIGASRGTRSPSLQRELVHMAAWLALYVPTADSVQDVLTRGGTDHPESLRRARDAARDAPTKVAPADGDLLLGPRQGRFAATLARRPDWAPAFATSQPEAVVAALADPDRRSPALLAAAWCPTLDVLQALLDCPVPHSATDRRAYGWALACMGDSVAAAHLQAVAQADPQLDLRTALNVAQGLGLVA